ncbi:hypothetical protein GOB36_14445 [Sinorhizobium meliloti]|uniref:hypothetical protein n=1 Tax=Rhizobium meliloti TaxID=382 RepID=UPI00299E1106|nr:hypothetical protein [Sinorhizobium meliloti]MDW9511218.1 hypothetical protein [Sinorhizobium meliloti]MDW9921731.1 hypothetical protein [Sinorhizobium meliloti]MDW9925961.1 hypothetical protein [Sinorhizobium meliloti]MDX0032877.1 hypothetical protein [Sinorhizobium meliloti]
MKIYFTKDKVVKRLARKRKRQVEAWGDEIYYNTALNVVARAFGHDDYPALYATFGMTDGSEPEITELARRRSRLGEFFGEF